MIITTLFTSTLATELDKSPLKLTLVTLNARSKIDSEWIFKIVGL